MSERSKESNEGNIMNENSLKQDNYINFNP